MLWAMAWVGVGLALWRLTSPFDLQHFLDDDPDNIRPRMLAAFYIVPLAGAVGVLRGRPIAYPTKAFALWLPICAVIFAIGLAGLF